MNLQELLFLLRLRRPCKHLRRAELTPPHYGWYCLDCPVIGFVEVR